MKRTIDIDGLPEGWEAVAFRVPKSGERFLSQDVPPVVMFDSSNSYWTPALIVKKKQPRRIVLEETDYYHEPEDNAATHTQIFQIDNAAIGKIISNKIWREVKESDLSLNKPQVKESFAPKVGEYFRIEHQGNDKSYRGDIFLCTASDGKQVVCEIKTRQGSFYTEIPFIFISNEWNFYPVTEEALVASGIKKDEPKLSLSVDECKALLDTIDINVVRKMQQFLKDK